jgi:hypothetical protein
MCPQGSCAAWTSSHPGLPYRCLMRSARWMRCCRQTRRPRGSPPPGRTCGGRPFSGWRSWHGSSEPDACGRRAFPRDRGKSAPAAVQVHPRTSLRSCAEIDANDVRPVGRRSFDLTDDVAVPAAPRVLREVAGLEPTPDLPVLPHSDLGTAEHRDRALPLDVLVRERDPAKGAPRPRLTRQRSLGRPPFQRVVRNSSKISWIT